MPDQKENPDAQDVVALTRDLIRIPSTADRPADLLRALGTIESYLKDVPSLHWRRYERNGKPSWVISTHDTLQPDILLLGHLDVVPGDSGQFEPTEKDGKVFGRGACDMKSGVAAMAWIFRQAVLQDRGISLALALTTDEEQGGTDGARYLVDEIGYRSKLAIIPDGGNGPDDVIVENKGMLRIRLMAAGKSSHASRPWEGTNAADILLAGIQRIQANFPPPDKDVWGDTCTLTTLSAGTTPNQVPESACATFDIRLTAATDPESLMERVRSWAAPCQVEILIQGQASSTPSDHPLLRAYVPLVQEFFGRKVEFNRTPGGNDGRYLAAHNIPLLIVRPPSGGLHGPEEWVEKDGLMTYTRMLLAYIHKIDLMIKKKYVT